jgi:hypothetical protein
LSGYPEIAEIIAPILAGTIVSVPSFCAADPPPDPNLTATDLVNLMNPINPAASTDALARVRQWAESWYWWNICECTSVATPAPPGMSNPGPVGKDNGLPSGKTSPCWNGQSSDTGALILDTGSNTNLFFYEPGLLPGNQSINGASLDTRFATMAYNILPTPAPTQLQVTWNYADPVGGTLYLRIAYCTSSGATVGTDLVNALSTLGTHTTTFTAASVPAGAYAWIALLFAGTSISTQVGELWSSTLELTYQCTGANTPPSGCCPPDPMLDNKINLILNLLAAQQPVSTSWTDGAAHTGLTGSGSFAFSGKPTGLRFNVTTPPAHPEINPGSPNFYWNMGYVTPIGNATPLRGWRLVYLAESFILPVYADSCGYTLLDGTVATATELLPA